MMLSSYCWALATPADAATNATARMLLRMGSPFISEASGHSWNPLFTKDPRGHGEEVATGGRAEKLPGGFLEPDKRLPGGRPYLGQSVTARALSERQMSFLPRYRRGWPPESASERSRKAPRVWSRVRSLAR